MSYIHKHNKDFEAIKTIVFYTKDAEYDGVEVYAESADIVNGIAQVYMPLNKDHLKNISQIVEKTIGIKDKEYEFSKFQKDREILSAKFKDGETEVLWFVKSKRAIYETRKEKGVITYPNLVFHFKNDSLKILATKQSKITLNTKLYKAPFPNIYDSHKMCFGTMRIRDFKSNDLNELIENLENSFYNSKFNSLMSSKRTKSNTFALFKKLIKEEGVFPNDELVLTNLRLKDVHK